MKKKKVNGTFGSAPKYKKMETIRAGPGDYNVNTYKLP